MPPLFTKVAIGGQVVQLRVAEEFEWRKDTLENPSWLDEDRNQRIRMACLLWCMLDGAPKGLATVRDVWAAYGSAKNQDEIDAAILQAWQLAHPPKESKNADGSTASHSVPSS